MKIGIYHWQCIRTDNIYFYPTLGGKTLLNGWFTLSAPLPSNPVAIPSMGLFTRQYTALPQTLPWPSLCRRLVVYSVDHRVQEWGPRFLHLTHLQDLSLHGSYTIYDSTTFSLPVEIGQLRTLKRLTLLNLPIDFPTWIANLPNLQVEEGQTL